MTIGAVIKYSYYKERILLSHSFQFKWLLVTLRSGVYGSILLNFDLLGYQVETLKVRTKKYFYKLSYFKLIFMIYCNSLILFLLSQ